MRHDAVRHEHQGRMITVDGKPKLDEKAGVYTCRDSEGKEGQIGKEDVVQIMER